MKTQSILICLTTLLISSIAFSQDNRLKAYNNFDFVPGEIILFEDDFNDSPDGEFPPRWDLISGQAVVNLRENKKAFLITEGSYGLVAPIMKTENYLTDPFTFEFDFYQSEGAYEPILLFKEGDNFDNGRGISFGHEVKTAYFQNDLSGTYPEGDESEFKNKWHHGALVYKNGQIKVYVDQYRVLVVPRCAFVPQEIRIGGIGSLENPLMFTNVKLASGGGMNMLNKILTDGRFVSHAIKFDVNKSDIKSESMGFLNELVKWLKENPAIKLEIGGHTDSDGDDASNLKLSQIRADAVKTQLTSMGIDASRLTAKGYGESKPLSDNATVEGKANNRRVEFTKM